MNLKIFVILYLICLEFIGIRASGHKCIHSQILKKYKPAIIHDENDISKQENGANRILQVQQPLRITIDYSLLSSLSDRFCKAYKYIEQIKQITEIARNFYQDMLSVYHYQENNFFPYQYDSCAGIQIQQNDKVNGISDSDLHIYVSYEYNPSESYVAYAAACIFKKNSLQIMPKFGIIVFNIPFMFPNDNYQLSEFQFQYNLRVAQHEMMHILAFDDYQINHIWVDPQTNQPFTDISKIISQQNLFGTNFAILKSPNVLAIAKNYFNCNSLQGVPLENNGDSGSAGSHWEKLYLKNEIMNPSAEYRMQFSQFTLALLKDCGYYKVNDQNYDQLDWGKGKGCGFVNNACYDNIQYKEFCQNRNELSCNFESTSVSYCDESLFSSNCKYYIDYTNGYCLNKSNDEQIGSDRYWKFGYNSKCFTSNILKVDSELLNVDFGCYQFQCKNESKIISININNEIYECQTPGAVLPAKLGQQGQITCPINFDQFCINLECPNFCSKNGYCLAGKCKCLAGYSGIDCNITLVQQNQVSVCKHYQYMNEEFSFCENCHFSCYTCNGSSPQNCTKCRKHFTKINNGECIENTAYKNIYNNLVVIILILYILLIL